MENNGRLRKEYKITPESNNMKVTFGVVNRKMPSVMYLKLNTWITYYDGIKDYPEYISLLNSKIKAKIKEELRNSGIFDAAFFYTPQIKNTLINNKPFHACFEFTIKKKDSIIVDIPTILDKIIIIVNSIISSIENNEAFEFNLKKS